MTPQKKVLKKRTASVAAPVVPVEAPVEVKQVDDTTIPSSRVSNYVSGVLLNKELDELIEKIKKEGWACAPFTDEEKASVLDKVAQSSDKNNEINNQLTRVNQGEDLATVLSTEDKTKVGEVIKALEAKAKAAEAKGEVVDTIDIREITKSLLSKRIVTTDTAAVDLVSKKRFKFSKDSFNVLATFGDLIVNEITKHTLDRLIEVGNSTIEPKYVFSSNISEAPLYGYYSQLPSFKAAVNEPSKKKKRSQPQEEETQVEETEEEPQTTEPEDKEINFKFYVKSIVYSHKKSNEAYASAKVSERYQKFCSDLVLDMLNDMVALSQIVLQVMSTKTISAKLFKAAIFTKTYNLPGHETVVSKLG